MRLAERFERGEVERGAVLQPGRSGDLGRLVGHDLQAPALRREPRPGEVLAAEGGRLRVAPADVDEIPSLGEQRTRARTIVAGGRPAGFDLRGGSREARRESGR